MRTRMFVVFVTCALFAASAFAFAAGNVPSRAALGIMETHGDVKVNRLPAPAGTALFAGDRIRTGAASAAVLKLGWGASVILGGHSALALPRDATSRQLDLSGGVAIVRSAGDGLTVVRVSGSEVNIGGGRYPSLCRIAMLDGQASVFAQSGRIEVRDAGRAAVLAPGKWFRLHAGPQAGAGGQQAGQLAGSVTAEIPSADRYPAKTKARIPLQLRSDVYWEDLVKTAPHGRVRLTLRDGSVLNVGAGAQMHIIEHHPQRQQTTIELTLGRMRAEAKKLTQPNAHFRVQTQTAVIGVVGTIFIVDSLTNSTRVWCIEGRVQVWSIDPNVKGKVTLHPGQYTVVMRGMPPTSPLQTPTAQLQNQVNLTNIASVPGAEVVPGVTETSITVTAQGIQIGLPAATQATVVAGVSSNLALSGAELGAAGAAAALSGKAIANANGATNAASQAESNAQAAVSAADNAAASASNAAIAAASAAATAQAAQAAASASFPTGCGCGP